MAVCDCALTNDNQAIQLDPKNAGVYVNRGLVYFRKGDTDRALSDCNQAIQLDPKNVGRVRQLRLGLREEG